MSNGSNKIEIGNAGEHYVAAELSRRGFIVAMTPSNTEAFDIFAKNPRNNERYDIQVKTTVKKKKKWPLNKKNELIRDKNSIYVFVHLLDGEEPQYHIVSSRIVANTIEKEHKEWLAKPRKDGKPHKDTNIRSFSDIECKYLNNWKLLEL